MSPRRLPGTVALAVLCLLAGPSGVATAATARAIVEDADAVRGALGPAFLNASWETPDGTGLYLRARREPDGARVLEAPPGGPDRLAATGTAPIAHRLIAFALGSGPLLDGVRGLGLSLDGHDPHLLPHRADDGVRPVWRIGGRNGHLDIEHGTAQVRQVELQRTDGRWTLDVLDTGGVGRGWMPILLRVRHEGRTVLVMRITDLARDVGDLAPLAAPIASPPRSPLPRLPL